ncbi:MAG: VanW family protein [Microgenomates group bacterium]
MITKNKLKMAVTLLILFIIPLFLLKKKVDFYLKNKLIFPNVYIDNILVGEKSKNELIKLLKQKYNYLNQRVLEVVFENEKIATFSAKKLNLDIDYETAYTQAFLIGRTNNLSSRLYQQLTSILKIKKYIITLNIKYDSEPVNSFIENVKEEYEKPARNALFTFENGRVVAFRKEELGKELLTDQFYKDFKQAIYQLKEKPEKKVVILSSKIIEPEITLAKANSFGIEELIGEGKSDFSYSIPERIHNITLASSKFNGVLIPKDKILSFNQTVGDISSLTGYKPAYIIKEGKTVLGDGGGVCQVSTSLFRAALNAGLPIIERHAHAYRVHYYENDSKPGFDATVFAPSVDLKIKNDTPAYILIQTQIDRENNLLYFYLYGKKDGRTVDISPVQIWDIIPPLPALYQEDPTLKKGVVKQIDFPAWGAKTIFHYKVVKENETLFEKDFFSLYKPWQAVYLVGTGD